MLFLAIHSKPRSRKDEADLDVKDSILYVKNVVGPCLYLGPEHLTVSFGFIGFLDCHEYLSILQ